MPKSGVESFGKHYCVSVVSLCCFAGCDDKRSLLRFLTHKEGWNGTPTRKSGVKTVEVVPLYKQSAVVSLGGGA